MARSDACPPPHAIRPLTSDSAPREWVLLGVETARVPTSHGYRHRLVCASTIRWRRRPPKSTITTETHRGAAALWQWIGRQARAGQTLQVVAWDMAYVLQVTDGLRHLVADGWRVVEPVVLAGRTMLLRLSRGGRGRKCARLRLFSAAQVLAADTLGRLGDAVGIPRSDEVGEAAGWSARRARAEEEARIVQAGLADWIAFLRAHKLGPFRCSLSGQAFAAWRRQHLHHWVVCHKEVAPTLVERAAYYGGRCEVFRPGTFSGRLLYHLDARSHYPACCTVPVPTCYLGPVGSPTPDRIAHLLREYEVIARVRLWTDEPIYPVRIPGGLSWPTGDVRTALAGPELRVAIQRGHLVDVEEAHLYEARPALATYVEALFRLRSDLRATGDRFREAAAKLLLNSLYGKFGQRDPRWRTVAEDAPYEFWYRTEIDGVTGREHALRQVGTLRQVQIGQREAHHAVPAIAATIASEARVRLHRWIERAGWDSVYYCDTDSLIVDEDGYDHLRPLLAPDALGGLRVVEASKDVCIRAPKEYSFGARWQVKGVPRHAQWLTWEDWQAVQRGEARQGRDPFYPGVAVARWLARPTMTEQALGRADGSEERWQVRYLAEAQGVAAAGVTPPASRPSRRPARAGTGG